MRTAVTSEQVEAGGRTKSHFEVALCTARLCLNIEYTEHYMVVPARRQPFTSCAI